LAAAGGGKDPYDPDEPDPAKCRAAESSLWEAAALRAHAVPHVAALAGILDRDLSDKRKTAEVPVCDMGEASVIIAIV
jgi:U3 small nucleolar RNA-associated protein 19